ncbi:MAG: DUF2752 domain-containing protein [Phycisphaerae bacterium]|nr:DUF2752 domain-containing protein [Phycisphaerae bacterium]MBN8599143.1 DUF2752 domain-containing protein [Planctomycetota bacterium]
MDQPGAVLSMWDANWTRRLLGLALAIACAAPLVIGAALTPSPRGHGTHEALGLPRCGFLLAFGRPCMTCGMTTAVTQASHGRFVAAFRTQPAGALVAIVLASGVWFGLHAAATGMSLKPGFDALTRPRVLWIAGAVVLAAWVYKIAVFE